MNHSQTDKDINVVGRIVLAARDMRLRRANSDNGQWRSRIEHANAQVIAHSLATSKQRGVLSVGPVLPRWWRSQELALTASIGFVAGYLFQLLVLILLGIQVSAIVGFCVSVCAAAFGVAHGKWRQRAVPT